jgi:hypothetical protein
MVLVGYARVSSVGQSLDVQLDKLKHCDKIYQEKKSGASGKRPQLEACLEYVRDGDTLVVTRLDRLARSTLHLSQIADELKRIADSVTSGVPAPTAPRVPRTTGRTTSNRIGCRSERSRCCAADGDVQRGIKQAAIRPAMDPQSSRRRFIPMLPRSLSS